MPPSAAGLNERRTDLDWIRVTVFAGLIFYHVGLLYAPWSPYFMKSASSSRAVEVLLLLTHPWRMSLLFLISGASTRFMSDRRTPDKLGAERSLRLLPPLALGFVLFIPLQHYFTLLKTTPYDASYLDFLRDFFLSPGHELVSGGRRYALPVYGHLWFVLYLWAYTVVLCLGLFLARGRFAWAERLTARALRGPWVLILPFLLCLALRVALYPSLGFTLRFYDDWYAHAVSFAMFLLGFLIAREERVWDDMVRMRWPALILAAGAFGFYAALALAKGGVSEPIESANPIMHLVYSVEQWSAVVALLGFGRLHLRRDGKVLRYLNSGVFTYYIVHQAALLLCLYWLAPFGLHPGVEAGLIVFVTFTVCFVSYELVRRVGWLRLLFGQRYRLRRPASWRTPVAPTTAASTAV
jgi:hypothetical protein